MPLVHYVSHPQVVIDPAVPVPRWPLSPLGAARAAKAAQLPWAAAIGRIVSSDEVKAIETAAAFAQALGLEAEVREGLHENDRSSTGYLPPPAFEAMADRFFANPTESQEGWERAVDAQARIVAGVEALIAEDETAGHSGDLLVVGHGGVGTLLLCALARRPIARISDQPGGGGNRFAFDRASRALTERRWVAFDQ